MVGAGGVLRAYAAAALCEVVRIRTDASNGEQ